MVDYSNIPRDSRRVPIATKVQFKFDRFSGFISKYSANISPTGMFVVSSNPDPPGQMLDFEFRLGDDTELIKGRGEVVWVRSAADGPNRPPGMGIRFLELSEGSKELIYRIVDQCILEGGMPFDLSRAPSSSERRGDLDVPPVGSMAADPQLPDLSPLDQEPEPFPDLDLEPIKDASGTVLPWFNAAEKWAVSGAPEPFPAEPVPPPPAAPPPPATPPPATPEPEPFDSELFASIEPALRDVEATFGSVPLSRSAEEGPGERAPAPAAPEPEEETLPEPIPFPARAPAPAPVPFRPLQDAVPSSPDVPSSPETPVPAFGAFLPPDPAPEPAPPFSGEDTSDFLPKSVPAPEAPPLRPMASLAGGASATDPPRRVMPWVLLAALLAVAVAAFLLRDTIAGWIGLGGEEEVASAQAPPRSEPAGPPQEGGGLTSDAAASPLETLSAEPTPAPPVIEEEAEPAEPLPEVVQRKPAPEPAAGPAVNVIERITWEAAEGGTAVVLWGNGAIRPDSYSRSRVDGPPRELVRLRGIRRPLAITRIPVGTGEVKQVRVGYHEKAGGNELHVVIDLADPGVKVARVDHDGQRLRIHLRRG
ncbi:MAG TPA: TIGR02266 family protein [Thermoanaerobaculia bacterium]